MKKTTLSLALLFLAVSTISQTPTVQTPSREELLTRARNLNTIASVALFPAIALGMTGLLMEKGEPTYTPAYALDLNYEKEATKAVLVAGSISNYRGKHSNVCYRIKNKT